MLKSHVMRSHSQIDHIYYNGTLFNTSYTQSIPAVINDVTNSPLLMDGSDWYVSVVRLGVSGHALPISSVINYIIPQPPPALPPYVTRFIVSLSYLGLVQSNNVIFIPTTTDDAIKFNIYTYQHWLDCINRAYAQCFADWGTAYGGALAGVVNQAPSLSYDPAQNLFSFYCESGYDANNPNPIGVYMNRILFDYFDSFEIFYLDRYVSPVGLDVKFNISATTCNNFSPIPVGAPAYLSSWVVNVGQTIYQMKQQYPSAYSWNFVKSLVLTSSIGTQNESIPLSLSGNTSISNSNLTILTDFDSNLSETSNIASRGYIQYVPTGEYRLCDLTNSSLVQNINIQVYYVDFTGKLEQLVLNPRYSFSVKLMFRRKTPQAFKSIIN
jgi:hypothetical protein